MCWLIFRRAFITSNPNLFLFGRHKQVGSVAPAVKAGPGFGSTNKPPLVCEESVAV